MQKILYFEDSVDQILSASDLFDKIKDVDIDKTKEHLIAVTLDAKKHIINVHIISVGILNASIVHPRELFRPAILDAADSIIVAHNHPSGDPTPSDNDISVTKTIIAAGKIIGIDVIDHVVFAKDKYISIRERRYEYNIHDW